METHGENSEKTVVVLADTHVDALEELPPELVTAIRQADFVIHLGDFTSIKLLNDLRRLDNFYGIRGNHDDLPVQQELERTGEVEISGKKLGLFHGLFVPIGNRARMKVYFDAYNLNVQAVLYGHTHVPFNRYVGDVLYFNPGSVGAKFPARVSSFGILRINETITGEIIKLDKYPYAGGPWRRLASRILRLLLSFVEAWP